MTRRRGIALAVLVVIGVGLLVTVVLVPWGDDAPAAGATAYQEGDAVTVATGDEFVIALPANPSTGYSWTAGDDADVKYVSSRQVSGGSEPGAPGTQELTFRAEQVGTSTLALAYARSFEGGVPPAQTTTFPVTVTK